MTGAAVNRPLGRRVSRGLWRVGGWSISAAAGSGFASAAYQAYGTARDRAAFPPPGRLVDIGGRRLHVLATGGTGPPVVIVPALGTPALDWVHIQRGLIPDVPVVLYDRAGLGWSDPAPGPRSASPMADELHALLAAAGIAPPYVLAGHSIGGLVALIYTVRHREDVAALALIDSSHPDQDERLPASGILDEKRIRLLAAQSLARPLGLIRLASDLGLSHRLNQQVRSIYPPDLADAGRALRLSSRQRRADVAEMLTLRRTFDEARAVMTSLPHLPLTVLTSSEHDPRDEPGGHADLRRRHWYGTWRVLQEELAALVPGSRHITAPAAGHHIHRDDPELVVEVLHDLAKQAPPREASGT